MNDFFVWLVASAQHVDVSLFRVIHHDVPPSPSMLLLGKLCATGPLLLGMALVCVLFLRRAKRRIAGAAALTATAGLLANAVIGLLWYRPRPFVAGVGQAWVEHAANGSFPSDHLTMQWCMAGVLLLHERTRVAGIIVALLGLPMLWARIYLGVHYPGDMLGALLMAGALTAVAAIWQRKRWHGNVSTGP